ncbi:SDR family oxidoreductase [Nafulsella turpanensis]|uniref:SDR family oxidoreductase n=1 Tax=Nafulsella turpanensis TaxID=1265690 RepID=UPI00034C638F|nr:SDR family oxidoreductase [Nafulsella turpanensis]
MKYILILGATSDIAIACAHEFARNGYGVQLAARKQDKLKIIAQDIEVRHKMPVTCHTFDALDYESHHEFWKKLPHRPEVTLCAFGYLGQQEKGQTDWREAWQIIETNFTGAASILNIVAQSYEEQGRGSIIGISSVAGERGRQSNYLYGSAKAGFTAYLSGLRNRLYKKGVHVLTVKPGFVDTKMTEGLDLPGPLTAKSEQVAKSIYKAHRSKKDVIYTLPVWQLIMQNIRLIPEGIFKKMNL